jgi:hypothetical protein
MTSLGSGGAPKILIVARRGLDPNAGYFEEMVGSAGLVTPA